MDALPDVPGAKGAGNTSMKGGQSWTKKWLAFDNSYFKREYAEDPDNLLWMSTDRALHTDAGFTPHFKKYAEDQQAFFADFADAFVKLSECGARRDQLVHSSPHGSLQPNRAAFTHRVCFKGYGPLTATFT